MTVPTVPGYEGLEKIGAGGFGAVYRATQTAVGREVALKLLHQAMADEDTERRFQRECRVVGSLSWHPHIAAVLDAGADADGRSYLAFELLSGGSLGDRLEASGPIPWPEAVRFAIQMADALAAAHEQEVLHRDVKPDNILIDRLGRAKLCDFGIAQMRDGNQTKSGVITATISHVAPEVLNGERATKLSDVYLLGSTLYELIVAEPPFGKAIGGDLFAAMQRIANEPAPRLDGIGGVDVPSGLADVVEQTLRKDPHDRFGSAAALGHALRAVQQANNQPLTAMPFVEASHGQSDTAAELSALTIRETPPANPSPANLPLASPPVDLSLAAPFAATPAPPPPPSQAAPFAATPAPPPPPSQAPPPPVDLSLAAPFAATTAPPPPPSQQFRPSPQQQPPPPRPTPYGAQASTPPPPPKRADPAASRGPKRALLAGTVLVAACIGGFFGIRALSPDGPGPTPTPGTTALATEVAIGQVEPSAAPIPTAEPLATATATAEAQATAVVLTPTPVVEPTALAATTGPSREFRPIGPGRVTVPVAGNTSFTLRSTYNFLQFNGHAIIYTDATANAEVDIFEPLTDNFGVSLRNFDDVIAYFESAPQFTAMTRVPVTPIAGFRTLFYEGTATEGAVGFSTTPVLSEDPAEQWYIPPYLSIWFVDGPQGVIAITAEATVDDPLLYFDALILAEEVLAVIALAAG